MSLKNVLVPQNAIRADERDCTLPTCAGHLSIRISSQRIVIYLDDIIALFKDVSSHIQKAKTKLSVFKDAGLSVEMKM